MEAGAKKTDAKAEEIKAPVSATQEGAGEDLSMEEILQSIRRIIAEDDKEGKKPVAADNTKANGSKAKTADENVPGSDVFELTEMVKEDGSVESLKPKTDIPAAAAAPAQAAPTDVLSKIDEALATEKKPEKAPEPAAIKAEEKPAPPPQAAIDKLAAPPAAPAPSADSLLSAEAAKAGADAFKRLKSAEEPLAPVTVTPSPAFRGGATMEDLVTEMLRPMMKAWLDTNLPNIVERIVEREVKKLTK